MTKEELLKLIHQEEKEREIVVTWVREGQLYFYYVCEVKVNLTKNRIEFHMDC